MSVYKRGDKNVFYMNFTVNGVRVFKSTGKFTKKEAKHVEALERQKIMDQEKMTPQEKSANMLLSEAIKQVYEGKWKNNKCPDSPVTIGEMIISLLGDIPLKKIDDDAIALLKQKLALREIKTGTVNRYLAVLKTILRFKRQSWDHIKLHKESKGRIRVISKEEETKIVNLLRNTKHSVRRSFYPDVADLVEVQIDTGMRLGETLKLTYEDINYESNLIHIWINKGDRPRSIPMTKRVAAIFKRRQTDNHLRPFNLTPYQADKAWAWTRKEMGRSSDKEFVIHALRHTCASRLVNKGVDLYVVKEWLGHSTIQVTEKYAHLNPMKLHEAVSSLNKSNETKHNITNEIVLDSSCILE